MEDESYMFSFRFKRSEKNIETVLTFDIDFSEETAGYIRFHLPGICII